MTQGTTHPISHLGENYDPWDPKHLADPYAAYATLRETEPMYWSAKRGLWFATRYDDVMEVLRDHARFSSAQYNIDKPHMTARPADGKRYQAFKGPTMVTTEPAEHTRLRRGSAPAFSPRGLRRIRDRVEEIADGLLAQMAREIADQGSVDLMALYARPLPVYAIAELLGIPTEDQDRFMQLALTDKGSPAHDPNASAEVLAMSASHGAELRALVEEVIDKKRVAPGEDLISALINSQREDSLTADETTDTIHLMMEAGHITTVNLIGNGLDILLDRPDDMRRLREEDELMSSGVRECLRFVGPVQFTGRTALVDTELGGVPIRAGEAIIPILPAANRDPRQFEEPDEFRIERDPARQLALGVGVHVCIGASLARLETEVAFTKLLKRFPQLQRSGVPTWNTSFELRGLEDLPVTG